MNEALLRRIQDPKFYLENFCKVKGKKAGVQDFILNEAQKDIFNTLATHRRVMITKARQIGFCAQPSQKVLTAGLEWVTLDDIRVGQEIVAVEEHNSKMGGRLMKRAVVEAKWDVFEPAFKLAMSNGVDLVATAPHRFLTRERGSTRSVWRKVEDMKPGDVIRHITKPWGAPDYEDGWFAGMLDGEGCLAKKTRAGANLTVSQVEGPVLDRLRRYAISRGLTYREEIDKRLPGDTSKMGSKVVYKLVFSKMNEIFEIIGKLRPARFISRDWWSDKAIPNDGWSEIVSIEALPAQRMIDLQTSEKTFIVEGFVSHNSTAVTGLFYHRTIMTPGINTALIGYNSDLTKELLDKVKTFYRTTPDALKPTIQYNSKFEITFPKIDSKIIVLPSTENVGRGYTLHNVLCVAGNTEVFGHSGEIKKVTELKSGDKIINGNGGFSIVKRLVEKKNSKPMYGLTPSSSPTLSVTGNHEVLLRGGEKLRGVWVPAEDVKVGDYIAFPYFQLRNRTKNIAIPSVANKGYESRTQTESSDVLVNRAFGRFVGWYLAEGTFSGNKITLSIHKDEVDEVLAVINASVISHVASVGVVYSKKSLTAVVNIYGKNFAVWMNSLFGGKAISKSLPTCMWNWGWEFGYGLLEGYIKGDGYIGNQFRIQLTSINKRLLYQIQRLLISLRIGFAGVKESKASRYGVPNQNRFDLILGGKGNWKLRRKLGFPLPVFKSGRSKYRTENSPGTNQGGGHWKRGKFHYWVKIKAIELLEPDPLVYDVVLDSEPHSFLTTSGVVHNCTELPFWQKAEEKMGALEASVPEDGTIVIESTPNGVSNWFYRMWMSENDYEKKEYGWWWHYSEEEIDKIRRRLNNPLKFAQEYELTFLSSGRNVFDTESLERQRHNLLKVGSIRKTETGENFTVYEKPDGLRIYHPPVPGRLYVVGVDVSEGVEGGDFSVAVIWDRTTGEEVAFYRGLVTPNALTNLINLWGREYNNALMVVEVNNHGLTVLTLLKQMVYPSIYFRPAKLDTLSQTWSEKIGWRTTKVTRPLLIDDFGDAIREGSLKIHSKELLDEMMTFVYDRNNDMIAAEGFHDDTIFAAGIGFQGFKVLYDKPLTQVNYQHYLPHGYSY